MGLLALLKEELKYQAGKAGKAAVTALREAANHVWENREAIVASIAEELTARANETRTMAEAEYQRRGYVPSPQPTPPTSRAPIDELGDYDEPTTIFDWQELPGGLAADLSYYRDKVGLYRMRDENGKVVYVGRAIEYDNGGLQKRLRDYTRKNDSGRKHQSGQLIHVNRESLTVELLVTGSGPEAAKIAKEIEPYAIRDDLPTWNKQHNRRR